MTEVQSALEELTGLLDVFLQGLVGYGLVSGYSLSLETRPELLEPSQRSLPLLLALMQPLQAGIKGLLVQHQENRLHGTWALPAREAAWQRSTRQSEELQCGTPAREDDRCALTGEEGISLPGTRLQQPLSEDDNTDTKHSVVADEEEMSDDSSIKFKSQQLPNTLDAMQSSPTSDSHHSRLYDTADIKCAHPVHHVEMIKQFNSFRQALTTGSIGFRDETVFKETDTEIVSERDLYSCSKQLDMRLLEDHKHLDDFQSDDRDNSLSLHVDESILNNDSQNIDTVETLQREEIITSEQELWEDKPILSSIQSENNDSSVLQINTVTCHTEVTDQETWGGDGEHNLGSHERQIILQDRDTQLLGIGHQIPLHEEVHISLESGDHVSLSTVVELSSLHEDLSQVDQEASLHTVVQEDKQGLLPVEEVKAKGRQQQQMLQCSECHRQFKCASSLETHHAKQHSAPQCCDMCGQMLSSTSALQEHCRTLHEGAGCFQCGTCKKRFMLRLSFRRHLETHEPATMAVCEICGKSFRRADYLQRHYMMHSGLRPHVCTECGKAFVCASHLKNHLTVHSGQRGHNCEICNRGFSRADKLKEHVLRHLNVKRHACSSCGREYAERRDLKKHMGRCLGPPESDP